MERPGPRRLIALVCLAGIAASIAWGCGGGGKANEPTVTPEPSAQPTQEAVIEPTATAPPELPVPGASETDRVVIAKIGVNAPISTQYVGADGQMPNPNGPDDIAFYEFDPQLFPGYGGRPGSGGNVILAGHVDWGAQHGVGCKNNTVKPPCQAVLWDLSKLRAGDVVEMQVAGNLFRYQITASKSYPASQDDWSGVLGTSGEERLTIITCSGDFNPSTREYNSRLVVSGVRIA